MTGRVALRSVLQLLLVALFGSVGKRSVAADHSPVTIDTWDIFFSPLLLATAVGDASLVETYALAEAVIAGSVNAPFRSGGVNRARTGTPTAIHLFVVDLDLLLPQKNVCGTTTPIPPQLADTCLRAAHVADNCAVIGATTIACDYRLVWRLSRAASVLAISSLKVPGEDRYWFPRDRLRVQFLSGEAKYKTKVDRLQNLADTDKLFAGKLADVKETRTRVLQGFLAFLLSHEVGHVRLGHGSANALPACAMAPSALPARLCAVPDARETAADAEALNYLSQDLSPAVFTPARAAPELFVEEHERRRYRAALSIGKDPSQWSYVNASEAERLAFDRAWLAEIATGSHPKDLARYVSLLNLLQSKGIILTASSEKKKVAETELRLIDQMCSAPKATGP